MSWIGMFLVCYKVHMYTKMLHFRQILDIASKLSLFTFNSKTIFSVMKYTESWNRFKWLSPLKCIYPVDLRLTTQDNACHVITHHLTVPMATKGMCKLSADCPVTRFPRHDTLLSPTGIEGLSDIISRSAVSVKYDDTFLSQAKGIYRPPHVIMPSALNTSACVMYIAGLLYGEHISSA